MALAVFTPKDFPLGRKKIIEDAIKDLNPDVKNAVIKILHSSSRKGTGSEEKEQKLGEILGQEEAKRLLRQLFY